MVGGESIGREFICIFVLIFNKKEKIKNSCIVINNIVIIIKKRIGGKYAMLLGDFALESFNSADSITFKWL